MSVLRAISIQETARFEFNATLCSNMEKMEAKQNVQEKRLKKPVITAFIIASTKWVISASVLSAN